MKKSRSGDLGKGCLYTIVFFIGLNLIGTLSFCGRDRSNPEPSPKPLPKCSMTLAESPALRGIKLGMTPQQVNLILPQKIIIRELEGKQTYGVSSKEVTEMREIGIRYNNYGLDGVTNVYMIFMDNALSLLEITYNDTEWESSQAFANYLTTTLHLRGEWEGDTDRPILNCAGFRLEANIYGGSYYSASLGLPIVVLKNEAPFLAVEERLRKEYEEEKMKKKRDEEQKRREFHP